MFNSQQSLFTVDALGVSQKTHFKKAHFSSRPDQPRVANTNIRLGAAYATSNMQGQDTPNAPKTVFPTPGQQGSNQPLSEKISSENVFKAYNLNDRRPSNKVPNSTVDGHRYGSNNTTLERPKLRIKGLTEQQFLNQEGISKEKQYMEASDFKEIFASQIREGQIAPDWETRYSGLFRQPPPVNYGIKASATANYAGVQRTRGGNIAMSISDTLNVNETQCEKKLAVVSDFVIESLDKLKEDAGVDYIDLQVHGEAEDKVVIEQVHEAVNDSSIKAVLVDDCQVLREGAAQEDLSSALNMAVLNLFDHGTQLASLSSLMGFLDSKNKKLEDCKIVIAKRETQGDFCIEHGSQSSSTKSILEALGAKNVIIMDEAEDSKISGADVYINFSNSNQLTDEQLMSLADSPIIMSIDQSDETIPASTKRADDAIIFSGGKSLSTLIFPYMTRAVLETESKEVTIDMKVAAVKELYELSKVRTSFSDHQDMNSITEAIIKAAVESKVGKPVKEQSNLKPIYQVGVINAEMAVKYAQAASFAESQSFSQMSDHQI